MKKSLLRLAMIIVIIGMILIVSQLFGQPSGRPPDLPGDHGFLGNQGPLGAPIDGGLLIFIAMGIGYGAMKIRGIIPDK